MNGTHRTASACALDAPGTVRMAISRRAWATLPDLVPGDDCVVLSMYSVDRDQGQWVRMARGGSWTWTAKSSTRAFCRGVRRHRGRQRRRERRHGDDRTPGRIRRRPPPSRASRRGHGWKRRRRRDVSRAAPGRRGGRHPGPSEAAASVRGGRAGHGERRVDRPRPLRPLPLRRSHRDGSRVRVSGRTLCSSALVGRGCDTRDCTPIADDDGRALGLLAVVGNAPSITLGAQASAWMVDDVHHDVGTIAIFGSGRGETHIAEAVELRAAHSVTPSFSGWPDAYGVAPASDAGGDCRASRPRPGVIRVAPRAMLRLFRRRRLEVTPPARHPGGMASRRAQSLGAASRAVASNSASRTSGAATRLRRRGRPAT